MQNQRLKVAIVVYNRYYNLKRWLHCWKQSEQHGAEFIVIHNYATEADRDRYRSLCRENGVTYVPRYNIGYDIGAMQEVFAGRLAGFDDQWDKLFWATDDLIPMKKDFLKPFIDKFSYSNNVGITCTEVSSEKKLHVRTSGFMIRRDVAAKIKFPAPKVTTKDECYDFEHMGNINPNMMRQINELGFSVYEISQLNTSPMWDTGHRVGLNRMEEHYKEFGRGDKVVFICPVYNSYPEIISSLICQTHQNWELILIHDGKNNTNLEEQIDAAQDQRITYIETENRVGNWGHKLRKWGLEQIRDGKLGKNADYVVITNADNHHVPVFAQYLVRGFLQNQAAVATYCSKMVHSYADWNVIECSLNLGYIDCAGVMIRKDVACEIGWQDVISHSSDWRYFEDVANKYGKESFHKVKGCLLIHN